ncbi:MAG: non-canonical purine NTP pyrophosphatase, partial [Candidatus Peregrinibacteria bacterium]
NDLQIEGDVEEVGQNYEENADLKDEYFGTKANLQTNADDTGIHIYELAGELGVKTRRWGAGEKANDLEWLAYFLRRMERETNRKAEFISVIALYWPKKPALTFRGECKGIILPKPQVVLEPGIPLSAVFLADGQTKVFSALEKSEKNRISHRGQAIKKCSDYLSKNFVQ